MGMVDNRKIGVIDSGVGGLTVAREFRNLLPKESIIYFGDNKNVPYGNKTEDEIYQFTKSMIDFLIHQDVKLIAVACNTISSILNKYFVNYKIPIISIIEPVTDYVVRENLQNIGVMATKFTIDSGAYEKLLIKKDENINVISEPCPTLAGIIDKGNYTDQEIEDTINIHMSNILKDNNLEDIILGCTHYPIVLDKFKKAVENINFINPAYEQVMYVKRLLEAKGIKGNTEKSTFQIYTTGDKEVYLDMINILSMELPDKIENIQTV